MWFVNTDPLKNTQAVSMAIVYNFIFIYFLQYAAKLQAWDIRLLKQINLNRLPALDGFFLFLTNSAAFFAYGVPLGLLIFSMLKNNSSLKRGAIFVLLSVIVSNTISEIFKYTFNRPRPFLRYSFIQQLTPAYSPSFPSGHTVIAVGMAVALGLIYRPGKYMVIVYSWALAVGYSRMDLGVHYPSDIIASILTALIVCLVLYVFYRKLIVKPGQ
ncbi:MAG TPA: phosphatase PAP2 family protein [Daejeonella sp.]|nr:MAG: hypothetical protein B7Y76_14605 [Sphingobacteriia bacterium 35-40-5]HQS51009.1 phosphatase PAP2 family protein [Daejeonella sp.]